MSVKGGVRVGSDLAMTVLDVRRAKAALSSGAQISCGNRSAGSNRSSHGGNEVAEAFEAPVAPNAWAGSRIHFALGLTIALKRLVFVPAVHSGVGLWGRARGYIV
jgi:hypothetical protein